MKHAAQCRCPHCETTHSWTPAGDVAPCGRFMTSLSANRKFINCKRCLRLGTQMALPLRETRA